jgi:hypothetical protein
VVDTANLIIGIYKEAGLLKFDLFKVPSNVEAGQIFDVVKNYLEKHPEKRHQSASSLVMMALKEAFPVAKEN